MHHRNEQPTLFELTACDDFESLQALAGGHVCPSVIPKSDPSTPERKVSSREPGVFRAVSPLVGLGLHEVCAACGVRLPEVAL